ncbi:hypothetical protein [Spirillospora sp. NPDC048819]|uniref:hypothetical protein n=1 Tax=Spirillospora sp. NPDC048819 TaxID=3155268 RepID=UPI0033F7B45D
MTSGKVPSEQHVAAFQAAHEMADVLHRSDLPRDNAQWWRVVISACNSGMLGAEFGTIDADRWAQLLIYSLDKARELRVLGDEEVIHRRMIACAAALRYFGIRKGDEGRDPKLIVGRFLAEHQDISPQEFVDQCVKILSIPHDVPIDATFQERIRHVTSARMTLQALCDVVEYLESGPLKEAAVRWCDIEPLLPNHRIH